MKPGLDRSGGITASPGQLSGLWKDKNGHCVLIEQDGEQLISTALENKGPVGWKVVKGKVQNGQVSMLFIARVEFAKLGPNNSQIRWGNGSVWSRFNASPSAADIDTHSWQQKKVAGLWTDLTGNQIRLTQNGSELVATALENKGPVGWKTTKGKLSWGTMSFLWFSRVYFGKVSENENRIVWGENSVWTRISTADSAGKPTSIQLTGSWSIFQNNGWSGKLALHHYSDGRLTGSASWRKNNQELSGSLKGTLSGQAIQFTITYPDGISGHYTGTLTPDGTRMNGTSKTTNGYSATWNATRLGSSGGESSPKIKPVITGLGIRKKTR